MLTPRLTNCQDCHKIPDLLRQIDCKIAELANGAYNNVVFMLGDCVPATAIVQLLAYKRILTFKYCNPHYGGSLSVNDIAGKIIRLTSGCVPKCNEPTVCEITTCPIPIVPNPTTTTTTTSPIICDFSGNIICIPPTTTTTTTTILPDCRVEGCFQVREIPPPPQCETPFNTNFPEGFPDGITGNGTKMLSNGVQLTTTYTGPTISPTLLTDPGTEELCDGVLVNTYNDTDKTQFPLLVGGSIVLEFDPPVVSVALVSSGYGYSSFLGETETVTVESLDPIVGETLLSCSLNEATATYETTQVNENQINLTGVQISPSLQSGITVITPEAGGISRLVLTNTTSLPLAGVVFDLYACGGVAPTTTTTTTVIPPDSECTDGLDVAFVVDYTQSMGDIIDNVKLGIGGIVNAIYTQSGAGGYRLALISADEKSNAFPNYLNCSDYINLPNVQKIINGPNPSMDPANTGDLDVYQFITAWELFGDNNQATFNQQLQKLNGGVDGTCIQMGAGLYASEPTDYAAKLVTESNFAGAFRANVAKHIVILTDQLPGSTRDYFDAVTWQGIQDMITYANANGIKYFVLGEGVDKVGGGQGSSPVVDGIYPWRELAEQTGGGWSNDASSEEIQQQIIAGCNSTTTTTTTAPPETWNPNTYFVFNIDTSSSFFYDTQRISEVSSCSIVRAKLEEYEDGSNTDFILFEGTSQNDMTYIDDVNGEVLNARFFLKVGMEVTGQGVPSGTEIVNFNGAVITVNNPITTSINSVLTFTLSSSAKTADYNNEGNLRNILQDYYATGLTEGEGNTDPATNGSDAFDSHLIYASDRTEHQIKYLANAGNNNALPIDTSPGGKFEGADNIIFQSFGDSSVFYTGQYSDWDNRQTQTDPNITDDVTFVKTTISDLETAAGNTTIYRGIFYTMAGGASREEYEELSTGLESGANAQNEMYAYTNEQLLVAESNGEPTRITYVRNVPSYPQPNEWFETIKNALNQLGYNL